MKRKLIVSGKECKAYEVELAEDEREVYVNSERFLIEHLKIGASGRLFLIVNGSPYEATVEIDGDSCSVRLNGKLYNLRLVDNIALGAITSPRFSEETAEGEQGDRTVKASMPGMVVDIKVEIGHYVKKGEPLLILEAMKMENEVRAPISGKVEQILVQVGTSVNSKDELIRIKGN